MKKLEEFYSFFQTNKYHKTWHLFHLISLLNNWTFLTNKPTSFQETNVIETGVIDHHKLSYVIFWILLRKG